MFGVDRSTVYRMAEDGRLPALKIGRQWRFRPEDIERLLVVNPSSARSNDEPTALDTSAAAVVGVAADLLGVMMVATDMQGRPLTSVANPCPWFASRAEDPAGLAECVEEWKTLADEPDFEPQFHAGSPAFECPRAYHRTGPPRGGGVRRRAAPRPGRGGSECETTD